MRGNASTEIMKGHSVNQEAKQISNMGIYKRKNLTVYIKREYGQNKKLGDIVGSLIIQEILKNDPMIA